MHEALIDALAECGFAVLPQFIAPAESEALRDECLRRRAAGEFRAARVGRGAAAQRDVAVRGDTTCWLDAGTASEPERVLLAQLEVLRGALNRALFLGLSELEAHYACYEPGAGYARHLDRFRDDDARAISLVLYLNEDWRAEHGGALRLWTPPAAREPSCEVLPRGGTLVALRSDAIEHEVLPAARERLSIAGWLRRPRAAQLA